LFAGRAEPLDYVDLRSKAGANREIGVPREKHTSMVASDSRFSKTVATGMRVPWNSRRHREPPSFEDAALEGRGATFKPLNFENTASGSQRSAADFQRGSR
jgi:hypothetical protein